jgi:hypothetical protein
MMLIIPSQSLDVGHRQGTGTYDTHITLEHIEKLQDLIQSCAT